MIDFENYKSRVPTLEEVADRLQLRVVRAVHQGPFSSNETVFEPSYKPNAVVLSELHEELEKIVRDRSNEFWKSGIDFVDPALDMRCPGVVIDAEDLLKIIERKQIAPDSARWIVFEAIEKRFLSALLITRKSIVLANPALTREESLAIRKAHLQRVARLRDRVSNKRAPNGLRSRQSIDQFEWKLVVWPRNQKTTGRKGARAKDGLEEWQVERIWDAWNSGTHDTYEECVRALKMGPKVTRKTVKNVVARRNLQLKRKSDQ